MTTIWQEMFLEILLAIHSIEMFTWDYLHYDCQWLFNWI